MLNGGGDRNEIPSVTDVIILPHEVPMARCFAIQPFDDGAASPSSWCVCQFRHDRAVCFQ